MARESQGLQIALIVSVMVSIVLGVSTFFSYRSYQDKLKQVKEQEAKTRDANQQKDQLADEAKELRRMIGAAETDKLADLQTQFKKDAETWLGTFPEKNRFYRSGLEYMFTAINEKSAALADAKTEIQQWKDKYEAREAAMVPVVKKFETASSNAASDYEAERAKIREQTAETTKIQSDLVAQLDSVKKESDAVAAKADAKIQESKNETQKWVGTAQGLQKKVNSLTEPVPGEFDGEIRWVNQQERTVWINRGHADRLGRQVTFMVYPANSTDTAKATKKASIEVTRILGDHLAEARILEDRTTDPIIPGDKINTLAWRPGDQKHFALTGYMDIDGQGKNDYQKVRNLITAAGGVIDDEMTAKGKRQGQLSINTRYLVVGNAPDSQHDAAAHTVYNTMVTEAKQRNIEIISLSRLLEMIGYNRQLTSAQQPSAAGDTFQKRQPPSPATGNYYRYSF